ncbi:HlyD family secretion protein [Altererythrobacter atlanticus]|uniref:Multidrug resistance protein MdtN n=1 Tax=Croceibacterium atlanticum TaxID=1267766 RepID=A0A0F7KY99_9SPHN|nr:HlyD family efflux transporter periplasmic adaptor subunit [Croceibacterium atlanticum]AKH44197.1 Multidrug resistance protein MdtN [Croceibacterium atlanticum]MBB5732508.1 HlyD family secretion protein [Croceibacterium atlanticum]
MNKRLIAIIALVALAIIAYSTSGFGLFADDRNGPLKLYGNVDIREVDLGFRVGGRIAEIAVEEGDRVEQGQQLARLDPAPIDARVAEADAAIARARAQLAELRNGSRTQDVRQASAAVEAARAAYEKAQQDVERREPLVGPGAISREVWQATVAARDQAKAQLEQARQTYSKLREGARPEQIAAGEAQLESALAARGSITTDLGDTVLEAPLDGTVVTRAQEPGAIVQPTQTVLTMSIDRPLRIRAYVAEQDLSRVAPGMEVEVEVDGNPRIYKGQIGYISPQAEFTPKTVQTEDLRTDLVYRMRIIVKDPDDRLRQGQPVTVIVPRPNPAPAEG